MSNKRIFYASQSVHLQPVSTGDNGNYRDPSNYVSYGGGADWVLPKGLQSAGINTTFTSNPVQQLGTLQVYSQTESVPQVEVTLNKVLDGTAPLYCLCTAKLADNDTSTLVGINQSLTEISNNMVNVRFAVFSDTNVAATGNTVSYTICSGMYLSRVSYTFPVDGSATEEVTLVGTNKIWSTGSLAIPDNDGNGQTPLGTGTSEYIVRRQYVALTGGVGASMPVRDNAGKITTLNILDNASVLPTGFGGIPLNSEQTKDQLKVPMIQNITISADLGRENINELGYFGPYYKYMTFPIQVTSEFQVIPTSGDLVDANDFNGVTSCISGYNNLEDKEIAIRVCGVDSSDVLIIDLGKKNKLTSVNYTGGDTGGGNATVTYSFQTFNKLNVIPSGHYARYTSFTDNSNSAFSIKQLN